MCLPKRCEMCRVDMLGVESSRGVSLWASCWHVNPVGARQSQRSATQRAAHNGRRRGMGECAMRERCDRIQAHRQASFVVWRTSAQRMVKRAVSGGR